MTNSGIDVCLWANFKYPSLEPTAPAGDAADPTATAFINQGRWMVQCPFGCGSAQVTSETDRRFFCCGPLGCQNFGAGYMTVPVVWPDADTQAQLEAALVQRPIVFRNWTSSETLDQVLAENAARGIG